MKSFWSEITKVHIPENNVDANSTSAAACEADICQLAVSFTFNNNDLMIKVILVEFTFFTGTFIQESRECIRNCSSDRIKELYGTTFNKTIVELEVNLEVWRLLNECRKAGILKVFPQGLGPSLYFKQFVLNYKENVLNE